MKAARFSLLLPLLASAAGGGGVGWFLRGRFDPAPRVVVRVAAPSSPGAPASAAGPSMASISASGPALPPVPVSTAEIARQLDIAFANGDAAAGWRTLQEQLASLGMEDLKALVPHLKKLPDERRDMIMHLVARRMGKLDPQGALAFGEGFAGDVAWRGLFRTQGLFRNAVVQQWADDHPDTALTWASALPEGRERTSFLGTVAVSLARNDPASAVAVLETLPENAGKNIAYGQGSYSHQAYVHHVWAGTDPRAAAASALALKPGSVRDDVFAAVAASWAEKDPAAALDWVGGLEWGKVRDDAVAAATHAWAKNNPQAALEWVFKKDPSPDNLNTLNVFAVWDHYSSDEARAWLARLPAGSNRDAWVARIRALDKEGSR